MSDHVFEVKHHPQVFEGCGRAAKFSRQNFRVWKDCELVEVVPGKVSGVPLIKGKRVPVDQVLASKDGGESIEEMPTTLISGAAGTDET